MRNNKDAKFQISFGMLFSIIIIIFTIAIAVYAINYFLKLKSCTELVGFYDSLKENVDRVYASNFAEQTLKLSVPGETLEVCFGNISEAKTRYPDEYKELERLSTRGYNVYLYPSVKKCSQTQPGIKIDRVYVDKFFCQDIMSNKLDIKLIKEFNEPKVRITASQ